MSLLRRLTAARSQLLLEEQESVASAPKSQLPAQSLYMPLILEASASVSATHANYLNFVADGLIDVNESIGSAGNGGSSSSSSSGLSIQNGGVAIALGHTPDNGSTALAEAGEADSAHLTFVIVKCFIIGFIILAAILGNMLVIVSVMRHRKLR